MTPTFKNVDHSGKSHAGSYMAPRPSVSRETSNIDGLFNQLIEVIKEKQNTYSINIPDIILPEMKLPEIKLPEVSAPMIVNDYHIPQQPVIIKTEYKRDYLTIVIAAISLITSIATLYLVK